MPTLFKKEAVELDIHPSISVTKVHMKLSEIDKAVKHRDIEVDRKLVLNSRPVKNVDDDTYASVEINISKAMVEPICYLPGMAMLALSCT